MENVRTGSVGQLPHQADDDRRIDAAGEKRPQRHFALQAELDGRRQAALRNCVAYSRGGSRSSRSKSGLPVAAAPRAGRRDRRRRWPGGSLRMPRKIVRGCGTYW